MKAFIKIPNLILVTALLLALFGIQPAHAASLIVNTNADNTTAGDNNCTLREAINNAEADADTTSGDCVAGSGADVITFNAALNGTPITLDGTLGQLPAVTTTITINGNGTANTIIQANAAANTATYRVFGISGGGTLTLDAMTVRNGVSDSGSGQSGGGIYNGGTLTLTNSTVSGNYVKGVGSIGGGIYNTGTLTLTDSTVTDNHADELASQGGGIYNTGTLIISGSTINNNSADGSASQGGGIYNHDAMTITDSIISGNHANGTTSEGGGILSDSTKSVSITNSTVSSNQATGSSGLGGGIFNVTSPLTITDSTISSNSATSYGGIFNFNGTLTITGSTINGNTATGQTGGGIASTGQMTITNSTIASNDGGSSFGGGVYYAGSTTSTLTNVTISGNTAGTAGGGIFVSSGTLNLTNSIVADQIGGGDCAIFGGGLITSGGYNIEGGTSCGFIQTGDQLNVTSGQLNLGALADNGGPTQTMALGSGSVALDSGNNATCAASPVNNVDQRGVTRPQGTTCDIGAYELDSIPPTVTVEQAVGQADPTSTSPINFTATFSEAIDPATFTASDITLGGTVSGTLSAVITQTTSTIFNIAVSGMTGNGTVTASISAGQVTDLASNPNTASTSTDNVVTFNIAVTPAIASALPSTGFAPNRITSLSAQPDNLAYSNLGSIWLEIPKLDVKSEIVGVPQSADGWNVDWLGNSAGWLNGTAFPSWEGNSVVTGHVYNANGLPGPFVNIKKLKYGDQVIVHMYGQKYIFEVQESKMISPRKTDFALQHLEGHSYITLITCQLYNPFSDSYFFRRVVRAVLVSVQVE